MDQTSKLPNIPWPIFVVGQGAAAEVIDIQSEKLIEHILFGEPKGNHSGRVLGPFNQDHLFGSEQVFESSEKKRNRHPSELVHERSSSLHYH
jgi:hypothetical protein